MVKAVSFFKRKPGMSVEAFQAYWRSAHPLVVVRLPGLRRYVQSHTLVSGYRKGEPVHDGIAELWFDDTRAMRALAGTREYAAVQADEAEFIDRATMGFIVTEEHVVKDGSVATDAIKRVTFLTRRPGHSVDEFQRYWREIHGPLAAGIPSLRRYIQSHTRRSAYEGGRAPAWDGVASAWFDSTDAIADLTATQRYAASLADRASFVAPGPTRAIVTLEHVIVG